jgi:4-amino-4-deoxy-L-arabinose transferase-like glycosyltransferase
MRALPCLLKLPPTGLALAGLLALYVLAGLFGHDPWKTEDVIHLNLARHFLETLSLPDLGFLQASRVFAHAYNLAPSQGLVLADAAFFPVPPLYYWGAALTGKLFGGILPLHDAMRLSSGLWTALTLIAVYYASREFYGQENAAATPLLLAGSFGLIVHAHAAQPMLTLLAAISLWLLPNNFLLREKRKTSYLFQLISVVTAYLGTGWTGVLLLAALVILLHSLLDFLCRDDRYETWLPLWMRIVLLAGLLIYLIQEVPPLSVHYFQRLRAMPGLLPWFSWPLLPLAGWSLWLRRRQWRQLEILLPLLTFILLLFLLPLFFEAGEVPAMLLLPPLALLATPGALALRRGAANAFDWFSGMAFSLFALLLWIGWSAMIFGWPERLARRSVELAPGFEGRFDLFFFLLALLATGWWIGSLITLPRSPYRCLTRWTAGLITVWLLAVFLWLPWIDYGKSYRGVAATLASQIREQQTDCVAGWRLGNAQRASFDYFERLRFTPLGADGQTPCRVLLTQGSRAEQKPPGEGWRLEWEGNRPGDRKERLRLYLRNQELP